MDLPVLIAASKNETSGTVLRIKRKRCADPHNTLLLHGISKKRKPEENKIDSNFIFHLAGTIEKGHVKMTKDIIRGFREKGFHHQPDLNEVKEKNRLHTKKKQTLCRYKILSKLRQDPTDESLESAAKEERETMHIYDIEQDISLDDIPTGEDLLLCNSAKMIREKLSLYDEGSATEYVYDVYYAPDDVDVKDDEILELEEYFEELVHELESDDDHDDSDDENAEDNWRNDYPDEDYYSTDEGNNNPDFGIASSDEDDEDFVYQGYREGKGQFLFDPFSNPNQVEDFDHSISDPDEYPP